MNLRCLKLTVFFVPATVLFAQPPVQTQLFKTELPYTGIVSAVAADASGNVFAGGAVDQNRFVAKMDPNFHLLFFTVIPSDVAQVSAIALDASGNAYITGPTFSTRFAVTSGAIEPNLIGCNTGCFTDAVLVKVDGTSGEVVFVTYLGGHLNDSGTSLVVASDGTVYVAGTTSSPDFPTTSGALIADRPAAPAGFVARISADGKTLISSTYLNGAPQAMSLGPLGALVLTGSTSDPHPGTPGAYQMSTRSVNLMASSDRGMTWTDLAVPSRVNWVEPDLNDPAVLYAATVNGLLKSADAGASWSNFGPFDSLSVTQVRVDPKESNTIYALALTDSTQTGPTKALWKTSDGGGTWTKIRTLDSRDYFLHINQRHPSTLYLSWPSGTFDLSADGGKTWSFPPVVAGDNGFVMDATDGDVIYTGAIVFPGNTSGLTLWHSGDVGQHWDRWLDRVPVPPNYLASTPIVASGSTVFYSSQVFPVVAGDSTYPGMRRTQDNGNTWVDVAGVPATAGFVDPNNARNIYIASPAGLFFSPDLGDTWESFRANMDYSNVTQAAVATDGTLYAVGLAQPGAFVAELDPSLARLSYYTCYGDSGGVSPNGIAIDPTGRAVIVGTTAARGLPVTGGQTALAGYRNGFVARFTADGSQLDFATFLGGSVSDFLVGLTLSPGGDIYLTGSTSSPDFPVTSTALQPRKTASNRTGFVSVLGSDGSLKYSTFLGGSDGDGFGAAVLSGTSLYLGGFVGSSDFPGVSPGEVSGLPKAALVRLDLTSIGVQ